MASHDTTTSSDPVPVPADHQDSNHPHYPRDLEHQPGTRRSFLSKKRVLIACGIVMTILLVIAAVLLGVALTRKNDDGNAEAPKITIVANNSTLAPLKVQTVYENATTFVYTTNRVPLLVAPALATSTIILSPTPRAEVKLEAPLRPIQAETAPATTTPNKPAPSEAPSGDTSPRDCLFSGAWVLKDQCVEHCPSWDGHETHCEVSKRSQWVCVSCPLRS
ncbi:hypothetical protein BU25DRAFT_154586 [Macroventuria anomochaeta]|uniref:Uncharacterized protein n=1 Tax=Macroventuria anomochaeta TaxID=301207 RepID=A0ACB6RS14_9PLEO|nr:uncharacterized protein BU25DRAFT_154586 [Macroventuria anomochaeta]KAF2624497.1 hypothetical protein BU25DRAFT_154586 [Macroventuria anomochaeta]